MRLFVIGDVVGQSGCQFVRERLAAFRAEQKIDVVVANGENSAEGNGILPYSAKHLFDSGVNVITTGNHGLRRREIYEVLEQRSGVVRPANYHVSAPGSGYYIYDGLRYQLCVINLQGLVYMESHRSPFDVADEILSCIETPNILVDFHAEATAEKLAMGFYLDGRVSAVVGTHTHVPTADERILPGGTAYITDLGMCGGRNSVLGVRADLAIEKLRTKLPVKFENEKKDCCLCGAVIDIDETTGGARSIQRIFMD